MHIKIITPISSKYSRNNNEMRYIILMLQRVVHEAYAAMDTLLLESVEPLGLRVATVMEENSKKTEHLSYVLFCISLFSSFFYLLI